MEAVQIGSEILRLAVIPAEIQIIADEVGELIHMAGELQGIEVGGGGEAGGIQGLHRLMEKAAVFMHEGSVPEHGDLILDAPAEDGGVMDILEDQLRQLLAGVLQEGGALRHLQHRDLGPDQEACLVGAVIGGLGMLIMGEADGIGAHLPDEGKILADVFLRGGGKDAGPVLMLRDAAEGMGAAVQEEAPLSIQLHPAETRAEFRPVHRLPAGEELGGHGVEGCGFRAVPHGRGINGQGHLFLRAALGGEDHSSLRIPERVGDAAAGDGAHRMGLQTQDAPAAVIDLRADDEAVGAVEAAVEMGRAAEEQVGAAVQAAEDREIAEGGSDLLIFPVLHKDADPPLGIAGNGIRNGQAEAGIAAPVLPGRTAVDEDAAALVGIVE